MGTASHGHPSTAWSGGLGPGLLLSCPPYPPPLPGVGVGWQGMRVYLPGEAPGGSRDAAACGPVAVPAARGLHQLLASLQRGAHRPWSPPHYNTNSLLCLRQKSPVGRHRAPPVRDTGAVGGQAWPVPWGHTRACAWAGVYTAGSGPLLGPTDPGLPSTRHPVSSPSAGGDQAMDGRHYQTVLDRRSRSNRVW